MYILPRTKFSDELFDDLIEIANIHARRGFDASSFNHIGKYGELLLSKHLNASIVPTGGPIDLILPNGQTAQVKTANSRRKEITCTYVGNEGVDLMFILELDIHHKLTKILYAGPFKEFVEEVNKNTNTRGWDNHRTPKKTLIADLQQQLGLLEFDPLNNSVFFEYK